MGTRLQEYWREAARFGIRVQAPFHGTFADGTPFTADALVEGFGSSRGTLIFTFAAESDLLRRVQEAGFSCSLMSEPGDRNPPWTAEDLREVLLDWEWRGPAEETPSIVADAGDGEDDGDNDNL